METSSENFDSDSESSLTYQETNRPLKILSGYDLSKYDIDDEMKYVISTYLMKFDIESLNRVLLIASLFVIIENGWEINQNISYLCDVAIDKILLKEPDFSGSGKETKRTEVLDRINTKCCILIYCRYLMEIR